MDRPTLYILLAGLLHPGILQAQAEVAPRFEVASIKPSPPLNGNVRTPMSVDRTKLIYNGLSPRLLVQIAYGQPSWSIVGGPKWFDSDHYDVAANLPPDSSSDQIPTMLRQLLAERFQLVTKPEARIMPVYVLRIAKSGARLKPGDPGEQWNNGTMKGGLFRGGIELHQITLEGLAEALSSRLDTPVIEETHLAGIFDISLKWAPDDKSEGPSIFTALTEQLGLKLEAARRQVTVLAISSIQKPTGN